MALLSPPLRPSQSAQFEEKQSTVRFQASKQGPVDLWNIPAIPVGQWGEEKIKILENVYNRIAKNGSQPTILAADFNSPKAELADGTVVPSGLDREAFIWDRWMNAELDVFSGLEELGMVVVCREQHGY